MMLCALDQARFLLCFSPLSSHCSDLPSKTTELQLKLPTRGKRRHILVKNMITSCFSSFSEPHVRSLALSQTQEVLSREEQKGENEAEDQDLHDGRNGDGSDNNGINGSGNGNGNDNNNHNGNGEYGGDEGQKSSLERLTGVEWWWWWKWQQARHVGHPYDINMFDVWPVDTAVQVVANGVIETIEPAVQAIVLEPIRQHVTMKGLVLLLVCGVFVMSCVEMFAGLAVMSMGVSLAGVAALALALLWSRPWRQGSSKSGSGDGDNGKS